MKRLALGLSMLLAGCGGDSTAVGGGAPEVGFARINEDILLPKCTFACHSGGEFAAGGLDLELDPRGALVEQNATAAVCSGGDARRVVPFEPEESLLYQKIMAKLDGVAAPCGDAMPPGVNEPGLSEEEAELVRIWIQNGATE